MSRLYEVSRRFAVRLTEWNDRHGRPRWLWKAIDRVAGWLYMLGEKS